MEPTDQAPAECGNECKDAAPEPEAAGAPEPEADRRAALTAQLFELSDRAKAGDRDALDGLRRLLDGHPEVWRLLGDLAEHAERAWVELVVGDFPVLAESVRRDVAALRKELEGPAPSATERLLVDQVIACRLEVHHAALAAAAAQPGPSGLAQAAFVLKRSESAQRRYLGALKLLTGLRALLPQGLAPAQAVPARPRLHRTA